MGDPTPTGGGVATGGPWETIVRWAIIVGPAVFLWSVASSMEQIARALTRLADAEDRRRGPPPSPPGLSAGVPDGDG